jgi:hypothetical protein
MVGGGCVKDDSLQLVPIVIQGDPAITAQLEHSLKEVPNIVLPGTKAGYSIMLVDPDPDVDYKIAEVTPDPTIDYNIRIIDPKSGKEMDEKSRELGDALRERLMQEQGGKAD